MTHTRPLGLVAALATACAIAGVATPARSADPKLETDDQKTFYAMGYSLSRGVERFALKPDELELLIVGLRDGVVGSDSKVPIDVYGPKIVELAEARGAEAAAVEKQAASAFLGKEAAADGATKMDSGLVKRVIQPGTGAKPKATDTVKVHYHGTLRDGSVFDSSVERGTPAEFPLDRVIPCWSEALQTMQVGEKAHITCPSEIAYGDRGYPPAIKGGAALAFDVELLEIEEPKPPAEP